MILALDIGNTNIVAALMESASDVLSSCRFQTDKKALKKDAEAELTAFLKNRGIEAGDVSGVVISSVVPEITDVMTKAAAEVVNETPLIIGADLDVGITIDTERPRETGADLIAGAAGAAAEYEGAIAIFDLGTATTLCVLTADRVFKGGLIMPGVYISMNAMVSRASQLHEFEITPPKELIGRNTLDSMRSGIVYGNAAMMDSLIDRVQDDLGTSVTSVVTGGLGGLIYPYCRRKIVYEPDLVLKGMWYIYERNKKNSADKA